MRPGINNLLYLLLRGIWLVVGICLGAVAVMLIDSNAELALDRSLAWGVAIGIGFCILAAFILIMLRPKEMEAPPPLPEEELLQARETLAKVSARLDLNEGETNRLIELGKQQAKGLAALGLRLWSGAAALGMAAAVAGSVIAMVTAFAAIRQVSRIDAQNELLEAQIFEAQASRAAGVFAAQLPSVLATIDADRNAKRNEIAALEQQIREASSQEAQIRHDLKSMGQSEGTTVQERALTGQILDLSQQIDLDQDRLDELKAAFSGGEDGLWVPSRAVITRIQATIDTAEPYRSINEIDRAIGKLNEQRKTDLKKVERIEDPTESTDARLRSDLPIRQMLFSPQRGQLLRLLIAANIDFERIEPRLDFSKSDFAGLDLSDVKLGQMVLSESNFVGAILTGTDLSMTSLRGSVFEDLNQIGEAVTRRDIAGHSVSDVSDAKVQERPTHLFGADVERALLIRQGEANELQKKGILGNQNAAVSKLSAGNLQLGQAQGIELPALQNIAIYSDIATIAPDGVWDIVRLGPPRPLLAIGQGDTHPRPGLARDLRAGFNVDFLQEGASCDEIGVRFKRAYRSMSTATRNEGVHEKWLEAQKMWQSVIRQELRRCFL